MKTGLLCLALLSAFARADVIYVVNSLDESLGWYNTEDSQSDPSAITLGHIPNDVILHDNLFVVNSGYHTLQEIDRVNWTTLREIPLTGCINPYAAAAIGNDLIAVTGLLSDNVVIVDLVQGSVIHNIPTGLAPQAVERHGDYVYVLNTGVAYPEFHPGTLKRFSATTFELVDSIVVGINPQSMSFAYTKLFISCTGNYDDVAGSIYVVEFTESLQVDTVLAIGGTPGAISVESSGGWIAAGGWGDHGNVYYFNPSTLEILRGPSNPILTDGGATDVAGESHVGGMCWVSCFSTGTIMLVSSTGSASDPVQMSAGPFAMAAQWGTLGTRPNPDLVSTEFVIQAVFPNPFNGAATLLFDAPLRRAAIIDVFDALGRTVESFPVGRGETQVQWLPGAQAGRGVATGAYFARMRGLENQRSIKVVYVK